MINNIILLITLIIATVHVFIKRKYLQRAQVIDLYLLYFLVGGVGVIGAIDFIYHIFFADEVAAMIGWPPGSPFQFEVGFHDGAWGLLGFLCLHYRENFWTATGIGWSFFMLGATYGHIKQTILFSNFSPYNLGLILPDFLVPVILLTLLCLRKNSRKT